MPDRLQELLRQRVLIQEHLAWLDREIAANEGVPPLPTRSNLVQKPVSSTAPATVHASKDAQEILRQFQKDASVVRTDARRGCLIIFSIAMGLLALGVVVGYYFYARHLGRWW